MTGANYLFWSEQGAIACGLHAPFRGSDTWNAGRWRPMHKAARTELHKTLGRAPSCETCEHVARVRARAEGKA
jgi:hypothetical protein